MLWPYSVLRTRTLSSTAELLIITIPDIFAFSPQIIQGADILSANRYCVFMPDFFKGSVASFEWFSLPHEETKKKIYAFVASAGDFDEAVSDAQEFVKAAGPQFKKWAVLGHCWGGKLAVRLSRAEVNETKRFSVSMQFHPAMLDGEDARNINVPHLLLASKDEEQHVEPFAAELSANPNTAGDKSGVQLFQKHSHGWMSARAQLSNDEDRDGYARGYQIASAFLKKHLSGETCS